MNHSTHQNAEFFKQQIVFIEENIKELTDLYISSTAVQERIKHFFNLYILEVEDLLNKNSRNNFISSFPKVYIGSKVTVWYEEDGEAEDYVICFPDQSDPDLGYISFLSPVGKQLLLKNFGETLMLKIPTGQVSVTIKEITHASNLLDGQGYTKEA